MIELMIVVVMIGILSALAIPRFSNATQLTRQHEAHLILKQILTLQQAYHQRHEEYAGSTADLEGFGYASRPLNFYAQPTLTATATAFTACMVAINPPTLGNRGINQTGAIVDC